MASATDRVRVRARSRARAEEIVEVVHVVGSDWPEYIYNVEYD